jgi:peptide-methionine (S)-S-oxide reductase
VTKVGPLEAFYPAEAYHQDYLTLHPNPALYRHYNDIPKVREPEEAFSQTTTVEKPTLVSSAKVH